MQRYDIILVLGFFRRLTYYLNIIKYLGKDFRIGLLVIPLHDSLKAKHKTSQEDFTRACIEMGAELVGDGPVSAKVSLFPQEPYLREAIEYIHAKLLSSRKLAVMTLAWAGLHDAFIKELNIRKIFVVQKAFFDFLLEYRGDRKVFEGREIVEVGLPYKKYPIFDEFEADYLLAIPTAFSFPHEKDKWHFLETVLSLLKEIPLSDIVALKPHNALDRDYFSRKQYKLITRFLRVLPDRMIRHILKQLAAAAPERLSNHIGWLYTAFLYERIIDRVVLMEKVTDNYNFAMEAFLPGVKKGVIGGLSNTIWGALFFKLPFYNCVDIECQDRQGENKLYGKKDPTLYLDLNIRFFGVPYCKGKLEFDPKHFEVIEESTLQGDIIERLRVEVRSIN